MIMNLQDALNIKIGNSQVLALYLGTTKVWPIGTPGPDPGCQPYLVPANQMYYTYPIEYTTMTDCEIDARNVKVLYSGEGPYEDDDGMGDGVDQIIPGEDATPYPWVWLDNTTLEEVNITSNSVEYISISYFWREYDDYAEQIYPIIKSFTLHGSNNLKRIYFGWSDLLENVYIENTSNLYSIGSIFDRCTNLNSIHLGDLGNVNSVDDGFTFCRNLKNITGFYNLGKSFIQRGDDFQYAYNVINLNYSTMLTRTSCIELFNNIYDMNLTTVDNAKIVLSNNTKNLLSATDIAIATNKGWTIQ